MDLLKQLLAYKKGDKILDSDILSIMNQSVQKKKMEDLDLHVDFKNADGVKTTSFFEDALIAFTKVDEEDNLLRTLEIHQHPKKTYVYWDNNGVVIETKVILDQINIHNLNDFQNAEKYIPESCGAIISNAGSEIMLSLIFDESEYRNDIFNLYIRRNLENAYSWSTDKNTNEKWYRFGKLENINGGYCWETLDPELERRCPNSYYVKYGLSDFTELKAMLDDFLLVDKKKVSQFFESIGLRS